MSRALVGIALGFALAAAINGFFPHAQPVTNVVARAAGSSGHPDSAFRCRSAVSFCMTFAAAGSQGR